MAAAGLLLVGAEGNDVFLVQRSGLVSEPWTWANPGGHVEAGETWRQAAEREFREEVGLVPRYRLLGAVESQSPYGHYVLFVGQASDEEMARLLKKSRLNWESSDACLTTLHQPGVPLHPALAASWRSVQAIVRRGARAI